jgi:hypothetical protein
MPCTWLKQNATSVQFAVPNHKAVDSEKIGDEKQKTKTKKEAKGNKRATRLDFQDSKQFVGSANEPHLRLLAQGSVGCM